MLQRPIHAGFAHIVQFAFVTIVALIAATGCSHRVATKFPTPPTPARIGDTETGIASWYGDPYHGRRSASGEIFDKEQLTAAHRSLPFQTWVEVTDLDNGKKVDVRIIDRGPFVKGRIIDLSLAAARKIEMVRPGTARVRLKVIAPPKLNSQSGADGFACPGENLTGVSAWASGSGTGVSACPETKTPAAEPTPQNALTEPYPHLRLALPPSD